MNKKTLFKQTLLASVVSAAAVNVSAAMLEEVIVTAQKRAENLQDVPISVNVVTGEAIQQNKIDSAEDLALSTPSINFKKGFSPSASTLGIRGLSTFSQEGGLSPSVAMVLDGVPVQRTTEFLSELGDVERIEVLRGPQGTLFGRNATAGAINLVRKRPTEEFEASVGVTVTDDDELSERFTISGPLTDNVRGRLAAYHKKLDDYIKNYHPTTGDIGGEKNWGVVGKLDIDISDNVNLLLTAEKSEQNVDLSSSVTLVEEGGGGLASNLGGLQFLVGPKRLALLGNGDAELGRAIIDDPYKVNEDLEAKSDSEVMGLTSELTWDLSDNLTLKSITAYREFDFGANPDIDATPANAFDPMRKFIVGYTGSSQSQSNEGYLTTTESSYFTQELRLEGSGDGYNWIGGLFYQSMDEEFRNEAGTMIADFFFYSSTEGKTITSVEAALAPAVAAGQMTKEQARAQAQATADGFIGALESATGYSSAGLGNGGYYFNSPAVDSQHTVDSYAIFGDVTFDISDNVQMFAGLRWSMQDIDADFDRNDWTGPAGQYNDEGEFVHSEYFYFDDSGNHIIDASVADPFTSGAISALSKVNGANAFKAEDRSEDWSGRIGLTWDVNDDLRLYTSASRGLIAAGVNLSRSTTSTKWLLNPSVAEAYEVGFKATLLDGSMRLNGALFHQETTDLQTTRLIPGTVSTEAFNAGTLTAQGLELDLTWAPTDNLTLAGSMTYLDTEMDDLIQPCYIGQTQALGCDVPVIDAFGDPTGDFTQDISGNEGISAPELAYRAEARYDIFLDDMPFDAYIKVTHTWQDEQQMTFLYDPALMIDSYGITDVFLGINDKEGRYDVQLFGKNVGDEEYVTGLDASEPTIGRVYGRVGRYQAYYGLKFNYNF